MVVAIVVMMVVVVGVLMMVRSSGSDCDGDCEGSNIQSFTGNIIYTVDF